MKNDLSNRAIKALAGSAAIAAFAWVSAAASPAYSATLSRSMDVRGMPAAVWSVIGPFCAIKDWLPPVGTCVEDGKTPPTRTLVTKDGKATFVETQVARSEASHRYSYTFKSSPLPVLRYVSTIEVTDKGNGVSTVTWSAEYAPAEGKETEAATALSGIYESGLAEIKARFPG